MSKHPSKPHTKRPKSGNDTFFLLLAFIILWGVLAWYTLVTLRGYLNISETPIPDLIGMQREAAIQVLEELGLDVHVYAEQTANQPDNSVVSQTPRSGTIVREGRRISLGVHLPKTTIAMPDLSGISLSQATTLIEESNLKLGEIRYAFSDLPEGAVINSDPPALNEVVTGEAIGVLVSRGISAREVAMPQLIGLALPEAKKRLESMGVRRISEVPSSIEPTRAGKIVNQRPIAGSSFLVGSEVILYYALGVNADVVRVPDVQGLNLYDASTLLREARLDVRPDWVEFQRDASKPEGIIAQRPNGYTLAGTPIALIVNGDPSGYNHPGYLRGGASENLITPLATAPDSLPEGMVPVSPLTPTDTSATTPLPPSPLSPGTPPTVTTAPPGPLVPVGSSPLPATPPASSTTVPAPLAPLPNAPTPIATTTTVLPPGPVSLPIAGITGPPTSAPPSSTGSVLPPIPPTSAPSSTLAPLPTQPTNTLRPIAPLPSPTSAPTPTNALTPLPAPTPISAPPPPASTPTPTVVPPASPGGVRNIPINFNPANYGFLQGRSNDYRLLVIDERGQREVINRRLESGQTISTSVTVYGNAELRTFVNGSFFQAWNP